jgi:hypothetical protein
LQSGIVAAEERWINGTLGASELWDSNFFRDSSELSEQITLLAAGVALSADVSRQKFSAKGRVRAYKHAENVDQDETVKDGVVSWSGAWSGDFTTNLQWARDSYIVDRWEAPESDVVAKDDASFLITHGRDNRFSFSLGATQSKQHHSSENYANLDYEDQEAFAGITYQTPAHSTLEVRYREGDRTFVNRLTEEPEGNFFFDDSFDFDYKQVEVENVWKISAKTSSKITLTRFSREGGVIDSTGDFAVLDFSWDATPKVQWHLGYSYKSPALGETIDLPSKVRAGFIGVSWAFSPKISVSSRVERLLRNYENRDELIGLPGNETPGELVVRTESQYNLVPLSMTYAINESFNVKLDTSWRKNESPIPKRQYKAGQVVLGLTFRF